MIYFLFSLFCLFPINQGLIHDKTFPLVPWAVPGFTVKNFLNKKIYFDIILWFYII